MSATEPGARPRRFAAVATVTVVIALASHALQPGAFSLSVAVIVVAALGIPHGSMDHLVALATRSRPVADRRAVIRRFDLAYLATMVAYSLVWAVSPAVALWSFLAMSVHHFGQSDLADIRCGGWRQMALQWSRGLFVVGTPMVVHARLVGPVLDHLGGPDIATWRWLDDRRSTWVILLIAQHVVALAATVRALGRDRVAREVAGVGALSVLFVAAEPLIGFAVYFGLWHSLSHLGRLERVLGTASMSHPMLALMRLARPRAAIALAALVVSLGFALGFGRADLVLPAVVVLLSLLTLPHLVVVQRLGRLAL